MDGMYLDGMEEEEEEGNGFEGGTEDAEGKR